MPAAYVALLIATFFPRSASYKLSIVQHGEPWHARAYLREIGAAR